MSGYELRHPLPGQKEACKMSQEVAELRWENGTHQGLRRLEVRTSELRDWGTLVFQIMKKSRGAAWDKPRTVLRGVRSHGKEAPGG